MRRSLPSSAIHYVVSRSGREGSSSCPQHVQHDAMGRPPRRSRGRTSSAGQFRGVIPTSALAEGSELKVRNCPLVLTGEQLAARWSE